MLTPIASTVLAATAYGAFGSLTFIEDEKNGVDGVSGLNGAIDVAISPDGKSVTSQAANRMRWPHSPGTRRPAL